MQGLHIYSKYIFILFSFFVFQGGEARLPLNFHTVEEGLLYRSAQPSSKGLRTVIETFHISTVINLRGENSGQSWWQNEKKICEEYNVKLVDIPMSALMLPSREVLLSLYDSFFEEEYPLLIHCKAGANRTGVACAIWRMAILEEPKDQAVQQLSARFFHFSVLTPKMNELLELFHPSRNWILYDYNR